MNEQTISTKALNLLQQSRQHLDAYSRETGRPALWDLEECTVGVLLAAYTEWAEARENLECREDALGEHVGVDEWHDSDDTAVWLLHGMADALDTVTDETDEYPADPR